jgi:hypothetical protein
LKAQVAQEDMDRDIPCMHAYAYDSDNDGPQNELDEDGFTEKEDQIAS